MKKMILVMTVMLAAQICRADLTPDEVVRTIINWEGVVAYNPTNNFPAEMIKADALNAELRLKTLVLESGSEELRICFALKVVNGLIRSLEVQMKDATPDVRPKQQERLTGLLANRELLVKYLREQQKASNKISEATSPKRAAPQD